MLPSEPGFSPPTGKQDTVALVLSLHHRLHTGQELTMGSQGPGNLAFLAHDDKPRPAQNVSQPSTRGVRGWSSCVLDAQLTQGGLPTVILATPHPLLKRGPWTAPMTGLQLHVLSPVPASHQLPLTAAASGASTPLERTAGPSSLPETTGLVRLAICRAGAARHTLLSGPHTHLLASSAGLPPSRPSLTDSSQGLCCQAVPPFSEGLALLSAPCFPLYPSPLPKKKKKK